MVMPVTFPISGDVEKLRLFPILKLAQQAVGKLLSVVEQTFKSDSLGNRPVVKEKGNLIS